MSGNYSIGIDLGTNNCFVGIWNHNHVEIIPNDEGNRNTPSYVSFLGNEKLVGESAVAQSILNSSNTLYDIKRLIGRRFNDNCVQDDIKHWPFKVVQGGGGVPLIQVSTLNGIHLYHPEEISAILLSKLKENAEAFIGDEIKDVVISVPAYFNDSQRRATKLAGEIAGLNVLRIINEPSAAAIAYGLYEKGEKTVLVFDLGGGTFDASVLLVDDGLVEVKSTRGNSHLGGEDFDKKLVEYLLADIGSKFNYDLSDNPVALRRLAIASEKAKRILSTQTRTSIELDSLFKDIDYKFTLSRAKFEDLNMEYFENCLSIVEKVLSDAELSKSQIDEVYLVGGSTRIPKIRDILSKFFNGKKLNLSINPEEAVAIGAAIQAAILSGKQLSADLQNILLVDVIPLSLGIETASSLMGTVIKRNTVIPCKKKQIFSTFSDDQQGVSIKIYEGERTMSKDNHLLGRFDLEGIPLMPKGTPQIEVCFSVDANGILEVSAIEKSTGKTQEIIVKSEDFLLSKKEVESRILDAKLNRSQDLLNKSLINAIDSFKNSIHEVKDKLQISKNLPDQEIEDLINNLNEFSTWLETHIDTEFETVQNKFSEFQKLIKPYIERKIINLDASNFQLDRERLVIDHEAKWLL